MTTELKPLRVLLVDDDEDDYELTKDLFEKIETPHVLTWLPAYDAALHALCRREHDICLLDYRLGGRSGLDFLRESREAGCVLPVILLTGQGSNGIEHEAMAAGASDYLVKGSTTPDAVSRALRHGIERHRAQEAVRERERVFRAVFDGARDAMLLADDSGRYLDANPAACALLGVPRQEVLGARMEDFAAPGQAPAVADAWRTFIETGHLAGEILLRRVEGEILIVDSRATANVLPGRHLSVLRDITERVRMERSQRRLAAIVESTGDAVVGMSAEGVIDWWNGAAEQLYGYTRRDVLGKPISAIFPESETDEASLAIRHLASGMPARTYASVQRRADRTVFDASVTLSPQWDEHGRVTGGSAIVRDMTESNRLRGRVAISDRMASLGTLAAGVAHEINNPLAVVIANVELAMQDPSTPEGEVREMLADAAEAAERVKNIVRDLKLFTRVDEHELGGRCDVHQVIESTLRMVQNETKHRARIVKSLAKLPEAAANEDRLGQVFLNLLVNAAHSIPEGRVDQNEIRITTSILDGFICVEIADTGSGIDPDKLERIFEPFFTTKDRGVGTGLGLSICHGIVTSLGGDIRVASTMRKGTTFRVRIPVAGSAAFLGPEPSSGTSSTVVSRARVLVVDDEEAVLRAAQRVLSKAHEVVVTSDARGAIDLLTGDQSYDVVVCDLMMPALTGMDVYEEVVARAPHLAERFVFLSGGAFTPRAREFLERVTNPRLDKPVTARELLEAVSNEVERRARERHRPTRRVSS